MSLETTISIFVTSMAPLLLVYFVVNGIYILQLDGNTYVGEEPQSDASAKTKVYVLLCAAFVAASAVLSICIAMFGGSKRAEEEHARHNAVVKDLEKRDEGEMKWFDVNLLKDDMEADEEDEKRFHFVHLDDDIGEINLESEGSKDNIGKKSLGSASRLGWCALM